MALLGSAGLVALSEQGNAQVVNDPDHVAAMRARTDAIFEVDGAVMPVGKAVMPVDRAVMPVDRAVMPVDRAGVEEGDVPTSEARQRQALTVSVSGKSHSPRLDVDERRRRWIEVRRYWAEWRRVVRTWRGVPPIAERPPSPSTPDPSSPATTAPRSTVPPTTPTTAKTTTTTTKATTTRKPTTTTTLRKPTPTPETTAVPETTAAPATTAVAETTSAPTTTIAPKSTDAPTTTGAPATTPSPSPAPTPQPNPDPTPESGVYRVTVGSGDATAFDNSSPAGAGSAHGTRVYCVISHFSHDDPVVFPRRPGASHAHMYWGNTEANAASTGDSLLRSGNSSCEGGTTNRSSYWIPAFFNSADEAVLPESVFVYYKSFGGPAFDRSTIQPIPAGLEMLATREIRGAGDWDFQVGGNESGTELKLVFPSCIAVDGAGRPVLSSEDNIAHLSYATEHSSPSGCPASHPYRVPTLSYIVRFAVPFSSDWYLASDQDATTKGQSLHGDYVAAWDADTMDQLVECTIRARRSCEFPGRAQLPERFLAPDGTRLYRYSVTLEQDADRTPFGTQIKRFAS